MVTATAASSVICPILFTKVPFDRVRFAFEGRFEMRIIVVALGLVALISFSMWAQQPAGRGQRQVQAAAAPLQGGQMTAADLAAIVAKQPKDRNGNQTFLQLAPYNVSMEHRVPVAQNASVHEKEAELFYIIDGGGTIVTGGKLTNENRQNADNLT